MLRHRHGRVHDLRRSGRLSRAERVRSSPLRVVRLSGMWPKIMVMAAYVISEVEALDDQGFRRCRELAAASIAGQDGRYLVCGGEPEVAEGEPSNGRRIVIVEFPDREHLDRWYRSAYHAEALAVREIALRRRLLCVDGVDDPS
jgi:uncharacterized protein (DUF1330 family)